MDNNGNKGLFINVFLDGKITKMEIDTGACSSVITYDKFKEIFPNKVISILESSLYTVTGQRIKIVGKTQVAVKLDSDRQENVGLELIIINSDKSFIPLIGRSWLDKLIPKWRDNLMNQEIIAKCYNEQEDGVSDKDMNFLKRMKEKFPKAFSDNVNDSIEGFVAEIHMKKNVVPIFCKPYSLPFPKKEQVEKELEKLCKEGILIPVETSAWATPIVVAPKENNEIRICMDCKVTINKYISTQYYPMPRIDDIFAELSGYKIYAKIDLKGAYLQLKMSNTSRKYVTINTHKGLFQYTRLPFGVSSAPAIFQSTMEQIFKNIRGVKIYLDDILIGGENDHDLNETLMKVFEKLNEHHVKVNESKCEFFKKEVKYLGHIISAEGVKPNPKKVEAIKRAPCPKDLNQLRSYLGIINYYSHFIPNLSTKLNPLYKLLQKDVKFEWNIECNNIFEESKSYLMGNMVLELYDPTKPVVICADASPYGYGAILAHVINGVEKPVLFASCTLNEHEKGYSQIHREAGEIMFAFHKFHKYVYGLKVTVVSDHEPLKEIFSPDKCNSAVALGRLKRWSVILSMYEYEFKHRPGKMMGHVDALSRLPLNERSEFDEEFEINSINFVSELSKVPLNFQTLAENQKQDHMLSKVYECVLNGWGKEFDQELKPYFLKRNSLHTENGVLYYRERMVVVNIKKKEVLNLLHSDIHTGIVRMKTLARSVVWWIGIDNDIEDLVAQCSVCQMTRNSRMDNTISKWPDVQIPLQRVHIDLFFFGGQTFLILMDAYSKYMDIHKLNISNAQNVIGKIKIFCAYFGLIEEIVSDNGPPFNSSEFINWCERNHMRVTKSPPYHPASNGTAERAVQTAKVALKKIIVDNDNRIINLNDSINNFLFTYRTTPSTITNQSPANLMFKYKARTPVTVLNKYNIELKTNEKKENLMEKKNIIEFEVGQNVFYKNHIKEIIKWIPCIIVNKKSTYVYTINLGGRIRTAHINQLRKDSAKINQWAEYEKEESTEIKEKLDNELVLEENVNDELDLEENVNDELDLEENVNNDVELEENEIEQEAQTDIIVPSDRPKRDSKLPSKFKDYILY